MVVLSLGIYTVHLWRLGPDLDLSKFMLYWGWPGTTREKLQFNQSPRALTCATLSFTMKPEVSGETPSLGNQLLRFGQKWCSTKLF